MIAIPACSYLGLYSGESARQHKLKYHNWEYAMNKISVLSAVIALFLGVISVEYVRAEVNEEETIHKMFEQAVSARAHGEYDEAATIFRQIILENPQNETVLRRAYNELVFTYLSKGDTNLAEAIAREALGWYPDITSDPMYVPPKVGEIFDELRTQLFGSLMITTDPEECRVELDGKYVGESPMEIEYLRPGEHILRLTKNRYHVFSRTVIIEPGIQTNADYSLKKVVLGPRTGFGIGAGFLIPLKTANTYGGIGTAIQGFGSVGIPYVPFAIIRVYAQGLIFGEENMEGELIDGASSKRVRNSILKLGAGAELFQKVRDLEAFVSGGISIQHGWNSIEFRDASGEEIDSWMLTTDIFRNEAALFLGANINAGIRFYLSGTFAAELYVQYDWMPNLQHYNENLEIMTVDLEAISIMLDIYFGQTFGAKETE